MPDGSAVGNIGVHDPFELIRHLARSQSDPRKAVAELVQVGLPVEVLLTTDADGKSEHDDYANSA